MKYGTAIKLLLHIRQSLCLAVLFLTIAISLSAQETNSNVSGIVRSERNEVLQNATVTVVHEPTKNTYTAVTNAKGYFYFFNVKPGGPYSITISFSGFQSLKKKNLYLAYAATNFYSYLNGNEFTEFILKQRKDPLDTVTLSVRKQARPRYGSETNIDNERIRSLPSISRNLQDYVRLVPNAKVNGDGMMSLAGQNNKYNAFFIDGSNNTDMLGLANSGVAGGQTNSPLMSIEAIEEIKVLQAPYDVQYSNFTGGSVNAITKSGSNESKASVWYFFRNEQMAGRSPVWVPVAGLPGQYARPRLSPFFNQTTGVDASGAFVKDKLFYFLLAEYQDESQPQPYNFLEYKGSIKESELVDLATSLKNKYGYDPGSFLQSGTELNAKRFTAKVDWNAGTKNKFTLSYRYYDGGRTTAQTQNSSTSIRFSNNRYFLPSTIHSASLEWRRYLKNSANNRFLLTYNNELTQRRIIGQPFPQVIIMDEPARIAFGSNGASNASRFSASEFSLLDVMKLVKNKHAFSTGIDFDFAMIGDLAVASYYDSYTFKSLQDFKANVNPSKYSRKFPLDGKQAIDLAGATAKYNTVRTGFFVNDDIQVNSDFKLTLGVRVDANALPLKYEEDSFFNNTARSEIEKYHHLQGATSGQTMTTAFQFSPRLGFNYKLPGGKLTIRGGAGIFSGHILNVWASQLYTTKVASIDFPDAKTTQLYNVNFNPDVYDQPGFQSLQIDPDSVKGTLSLVSRHYKYPTVFRSSLTIDKNFSHNWNLATEFLFTKNVHENRYTNVNIMPPSQTSASPGSRNVFSSGDIVNKIPLPGGDNPYSAIFLLANNHGKTGYSYGFNAVISKAIAGNLLVNLAYSFQNSVSLFEPIGNANTTDGQWSQLETVNGKNLASRTISDFDLNHRVSAAISKKFSYGPCSTMITLFYNGQSGAPFTYIFSNSIINDNGRKPTSNADLLYVPTVEDLAQMKFLSFTDGNITYTPEQQKDYLEYYIEHNKYLREHRGQFSQRNEARLPFTNTVDLRLQQDFKVTVNKKQTTISIIYDVFNFTNMLNKEWGRTYLLSETDNFPVMTFLRFADPNTLTPLYQFKPISGDPWTIQSSSAPGNSARWISQLGVKVSF